MKKLTVEEEKRTGESKKLEGVKAEAAAEGVAKKEEGEIGDGEMGSEGASDLNFGISMLNL